MKIGFVAPLLILAACSSPTPEAGNGAASNQVADAVVPPETVSPEAIDRSGRWVGVEGMYLDVKKAASPGRYSLSMQWDLDNKGVFEGTAKGDTIVFERNGIQETLRPSDGAATGLKYLAGKTDCLTVKPGEGYCRG